MLTGMDTHVALPERTRSVRRQLGLTQAQFAPRLGISAGAVSRLETGDLTAVGVATATRLMDLLGDLEQIESEVAS